MKSSCLDRRGSSWRVQAEAALIAGLSYVSAASAAAVAAASASTLVNEIIIAAATGSVGGLVGLLAATLVRQTRGSTPGGAGPSSWIMQREVACCSGRNRRPRRLLEVSTTPGNLERRNRKP